MNNNISKIMSEQTEKAEIITTSPQNDLVKEINPNNSPDHKICELETIASQQMEQNINEKGVEVKQSKEYLSLNASNNGEMLVNVGKIDVENTLKQEISEEVNSNKTKTFKNTSGFQEITVDLPKIAESTMSTQSDEQNQNEPCASVEIAIKTNSPCILETKEQEKTDETLQIAENNVLTQFGEQNQEELLESDVQASSAIIAEPSESMLKDIDIITKTTIYILETKEQPKTTDDLSKITESVMTVQTSAQSQEELLETSAKHENDVQAQNTNTGEQTSENMQEDIAEKTQVDDIIDKEEANANDTSMQVDFFGKNEIVPQVNAQSNALSLLANYISDNSDVESLCSDNDSIIEVTTRNSNDYRHQIVEIKSDSDSDSDTSDSSNKSQKIDRFKKLRKAINKKMANDEVEDDEDEEGDGENKKSKNYKPPKVKGEFLLQDLPLIQDLHITVPEEECTELGRVHSIVDQLLLVSVQPNSTLLDLDTVLFLDKGKRVLGEVFDVLGQITNPLYCVRFNSNQQIKEKNISIGEVVYVALRTQYTQFVILSSLMSTRGSDASWENDVEPPQRYLDYSDDEQERLARGRVRNRDRQQTVTENQSHKRARNEDNDDTISIASIDTLNSEQSTSSNWYRRGHGHRRARGHGQRGYSHNYPIAAQSSDSWHSNFYHYGPPPFGMPPMPMYNQSPNMRAPFQLPSAFSQKSSNYGNHKRF